MKRIFVIDGTAIVAAAIIFAIGYRLGKKDAEKGKSEGS